MILALDPSSTALGWALADGSKIVDAGVVRPASKDRNAVPAWVKVAVTPTCVMELFEFPGKVSAFTL